MKVRQVISLALVGCALAWGGWATVAMIQNDAPPIEAVSAAIPAISLLLFAGAAWPSRRPDEMHGFEVVTNFDEK
jgi:hypothetical protein